MPQMFTVPGLGIITWTPGINNLVADSTPGAKWVWQSLKRHARHDWGEMELEDLQANDEALITGDRLFSAYLHPQFGKIWIITEGKDDDDVRRSTTILLPEEY